jgi:hypothetical protein
MPDYIVEALSRMAISDAFPMMHLVMPKLDLQSWQRFARFTLHTSRNRPAGILIVRRSARRHICGLVCYRLAVDPTYGRIIQACHLTGIDILNPRPIVLLLLQHLGVLARSNGCTTVHIRIPNGASAASLRSGILGGCGFHTRVCCSLDIELALKESLPGEVMRVEYIAKDTPVAS